MKEQRWSATYSYEYKKSPGVYRAIKLDLSDILNPLIKRVKERWPKMNQYIVDWYTSSDYLRPYSYEKEDLIPGEPIVSFSYGGIRTLRINAKETDQEVQKLDVFIRNNSAIEMRGDMQKTHKHEILKIAKSDQTIPNNHINITFRAIQ